MNKGCNLVHCLLRKCVKHAVNHLHFSLVTASVCDAHPVISAMDDLDKCSSLDLETEILSKEGILKTTNLWILLFQKILTGID